MERIKFKVNEISCSVGCETSSDVTLLDYIRETLELRGTKYMCREGGCGACIVAARRPGTSAAAVNSCLVSVTSCSNWEITTIEALGNKMKGYHPLQTTLAEHNGTQCGYCTPGWIMSMYSLLQSRKNLTMLDIEKSLDSNICRCTGYRPILDAMKTFATDAPKTNAIPDIEDLIVCKSTGGKCSQDKCEDSDWCFVNSHDVTDNFLPPINLKDGIKWFGVSKVSDVFEILKREGHDSYMLVCGNTAKGVYPIIAYPRILIDISNLKELKGLTVDQNLVIGAGTTLSDLLQIFGNFKTYENFKYLTKFYDHLKLVAHTSVRNLGSIGGNLMIKHQHNEFPSDIFLMLEVIGAQLTLVRNPNKIERFTMTEFLKTNMRGAIILNILLPPLNDSYKIETYKIMPRSQNSKAIVNAGFLYKLNANNCVKQCTIVYGGLSPAFSRAVSTENFLTKKVLFLNTTLQGALSILETELVVTENPPELSAKYRKRLALGLFYKGLLSLCPLKILEKRYHSGIIKLHESRPVSVAQQVFETNPNIWPLNKPVQKVEAIIQCSGEAVFTDDIPKLPRQVFAAFVLSTVPNGSVVTIDTSVALNKPGVIAFYSAKDIPGDNSFTPGDMPPLNTADEEVFCTGEVKFYNQPIGVIVAQTQYLAETAANLVKVTYSNVEKAVLDIKTAINIPNRVSLYTSIDATDIGKQTHKVLRGSSTIYGQHHFSMETIVCVANTTEEGLEVHATSQWINCVQIMISRALKLPENKIDVYVRRLGGAFGIKATRSVQMAVACGLVTQKLNRPCRFVTPLRTVMRAVGKRLGCHVDYEFAVNKLGEIQYVNYSLFEDNGYIFNEPMIMVATDAYYNCYDQKRWNYKSYNVITDTPSNTWCRCPGTLEGVANAELIMERISYELSQNPLQVRFANVSSDHEIIKDMAQTLMKDAQYEKRRAEVDKFNVENRWKKRGLRFSFMRWFPQGEQYHDVNLAVYHDDGSIVLTHGGIDMGQGLNTKAIQIAAYMLKVPMEKIQIKANSTIIAPNGQMSAESITSTNVSIGVQRCCLQLLERLAPLRNEMGNPTWEKLIKRAYLLGIDLQAHGFVTITDVQLYHLYGVSLAEIEMDVLTGEFEILRVDILQDVGRSVSPNIDIGQIEGAFIMGIGYWTSENIVYDENTGSLLTDRTWHYKVPMARDIPQDFRVKFSEKSFGPTAILGAKGIGEPPMALAIVVTFALREAIVSARNENGLPSSQWFQIDGPWTLDKICLSTATKIEDFKFY